MYYILYHGLMHREDGSIYEGGVLTEVKFRRLSEKRLKRRYATIKHKNRQQRRILDIRPPHVITCTGYIAGNRSTTFEYWPDEKDLKRFRKKHSLAKYLSDKLTPFAGTYYAWEAAELRKRKTHHADLTWVDYQQDYRDEGHRDPEPHERDCPCHRCEYERQYWRDCADGMFDDATRDLHEDRIDEGLICPYCDRHINECRCGDDGSCYGDLMEEEHRSALSYQELEDLRSYHTELDDFFNPGVIDVTSLRKDEEPTVYDKLRLLNNYCQKCSSQIHPTQGCNCPQEPSIYHDEDLEEVVNMGDDDWNYSE